MEDVDPEGHAVAVLAAIERIIHEQQAIGPGAQVDRIFAVLMGNAEVFTEPERRARTQVNARKAADTKRKHQHAWTSGELAAALTFLPDVPFSGHPQFDRAGERVTGRPSVGISLTNALLGAGLIVRGLVDEDGFENSQGPYLRYRKT